MPSEIIPQSTQILVIGGGPAGSYAASALAREGFSVVLLEAAKFPRYHIGESLLPSVRAFLKFIDAEEEVKAYGFVKKPGGAAKLNQYKREGYTDFVAVDPDSGSWQVIRSEFDDLLLRHAIKSGASVFQETQVTEIHFAEEQQSHSSPRPIAASYQTASGTLGKITFDYLVDASGRNGLMSTRYLKNRRFNKTLRNVACWGYWEGTGRYMPGSGREGAIWIEALTDESGWAWFIPLHDGSTSVGIVMDQTISTQKKRASGHSLQEHYLAELRAFAPGTLKLIEEGTLRGEGSAGAVKSASDYSYSAEGYSGDHFRLAGDAGAFIDPFFSSGVHLAFTGGLAAAVTIAASIRGDVSEADAGRWHDAKVGVSYTRFLLVVLGVYKQIRNQDAPVMSDVDEDNFDRAFESIRPVIQGTADVGKVVTEDELQRTMDLVQHIFGPTNPDMQHSVFSRIDPALLSPEAPVLTRTELDRLFGAHDDDAKIVLANINAWKPLRPLLQPALNFSAEPHHGCVAVVERGKLGLRKSAEEPVR